MKTGKNLIVLFAVLFISFLSLIQEAEADCTYPEVAEFVSVNYGDCRVDIYYCVMLDPNNVYHTRIDRILIDIDCVNDITTGEFWSFINSTILDDMEENYSFPQCPAMTYNVITSRAKCWKVTNDHTNGICNILNCGYDGECQMFYKVCTDYTQSPVVTFRELVNSQSIDNETCSAEMPDFSDEEEFDPDEDWTTECFVISCDID